MRPVIDARRTGLKATLASLRDLDGGFVEYAQPGDISPEQPAPGYLMLACPGCGRVSGMRVGDSAGLGSPSWLFTAGPTLHPSINCVGCCGWHGWLTNGVFHSC